MTTIQKVQNEVSAVMAQIETIEDKSLRSRYRVATEKGMAMFMLGHKAMKLIAGGYSVRSTTDESVSYTVKHAPDGLLSCDCAAGAKGQPCKHRALVRITIGK